MIIRKCSQGHRVRIHRNTSPGVSRTKKYKNGTVETITYPSAYDYFIDAIKNKLFFKNLTFAPLEKDLIEDLIISAVNNALSKAQAESQSRMNSVTGGMLGGMKLPGM